jgi:hypothetical protein
MGKLTSLTQKVGETTLENEQEIKEGGLSHNPTRDSVD